MYEDILKPCIRPVTEADRLTLPEYSHSKLECYTNCAMQYKLKYIDEKTSTDTSIALELGSLLHYVLEQKFYMLKEGCIDYSKLEKILNLGVVPDENDNKTKEQILGIKELQKKYFELWYEKDEKSKMTYPEKLKIYDKVLHEELEDKDWIPYKAEHPFEFVYKNRAIIHGFIDLICINKDGEFMVKDYKSSKKVFDDKHNATAQQMGIYGLAILNEFGKVPIKYQYDFILLDKYQSAMTTGWGSRLIKKLDRILDLIDESTKTKIYKPKPSPLCFWCSYCKTNPDAKKYNQECEYYCLWTPFEKTFSTNKIYNPDEILKINKRKNAIFDW